jgi:PhoPQ-activated pathogenicity-related protein
VPIPNTPEANRLWSMVDPFSYRDQLTLPKLLINGNNDPYWSTDALNLYWDGLKGSKWLCYVPNAGHGLQQEYGNGKKDTARAVSALGAFARHFVKHEPMPRLQWKHDDLDGTLLLSAESTPAARAARLWIAHAPTQDFRKATWHDEPVAIVKGVVVGMVTPPRDGYVAFYAELDFAIDDVPYHLSTQLRLAGKKSRGVQGF